jgi:hypothetical protein
MRFAIFALLIALAPPAPSAEEDDWGALPPAPKATAAVPPEGGVAGPVAASPGSPASAPIPVPGRSAETARRIQLLRVRANGLYRARKYRAARDLYAACARLDTGDAGARNDLAGCHLKLGQRDSALAASRAALRLAGRSLASPDAGAWSFPDLRARKSAYFLLDKVGAPMSAPGPGRCEAWTAAEGECRARLYVCAERGGRAEAGGALRWDILRAGLSAARAAFSPEELESPSQLPRPEPRDMEAASIGGAPESESRWVNRDSSVTLPLGEFLETADPACSGPACGSLEQERIGCRILHFDPCAGVIGMACAYQEEGGPDRIVIGEWYLIPSRQP